MPRLAEPTPARATPPNTRTVLEYAHTADAKARNTACLSSRRSEIPITRRYLELGSWTSSNSLAVFISRSVSFHSGCRLVCSMSGGGCGGPPKDRHTKQRNTEAKPQTHTKTKLKSAVNLPHLGGPKHFQLSARICEGCIESGGGRYHPYTLQGPCRCQGCTHWQQLHNVKVLLMSKGPRVYIYSLKTA